MAFDLHAHSDVSDGTDTPAALVRAAAEAGLAGVALTDHDTTAGWDEAAAAAIGAGITFVPGIEISTRFGRDSIHLLGYVFDPTDARLVAELTRIRQARDSRARDMVGLIGRDFPLTWDDVVDHTEPGSTVGRPHIADALVTAGVVGSRAEAFAGLLSSAGPYYLPHYAPDLPQAVELVRAAGGVAVIAHPGAVGRGNRASNEAVAAACAAGLTGLEIHHRDNPAGERARLQALCDRYDLIVTGGSDYHGTGKPNRLGENSTPADTVSTLLERAAGSRAG